MPGTGTLKIEQEEREALLFERMIERFLKRWQPEDRFDADEFDRDLHVLVRQIYQDAQKPVLEQFGKLASLTPFPGIIPKTGG